MATSRMTVSTSSHSALWMSVSVVTMLLEQYCERA
jgi:hypothetical protein